LPTPTASYFSGPEAAPLHFAGLWGENRSHPKPLENLIFGPVHLLEPGGGSIVERAKVQHAVQGVKQQLVPNGRAHHTGLPPGFGDADDYFPADYTAAGVFIYWESQNVGGAANRHKLLVQP